MYEISCTDRDHGMEKLNQGICNSLAIFNAHVTYQKDKGGHKNSQSSWTDEVHGASAFGETPI